MPIDPRDREGKHFKMSAIQKRVLRVVLASPNDVQGERDAMQSIINEVNSVLRDIEYHIILELRRWETDAYPGLHLQGPQGRIDEILDIEHCDVLIGVFWRKFGTPVHDAGSGTAHEIKLAISAWQKKGSPEVMLYFRTATESSNDDEREQSEALKEFKDELLAMEPQPLYWQYGNVDDFEGQVRAHLLKHAVRIARDTGVIQDIEWEFEASTESVVVRSEGLTELVGSIRLRCTCVAESPKSLNLNVTVNLNTQVSSDEAFMFGEGRSNLRTVWSPTHTDRYHIVFSGIWVPAFRPHESRVFQICNLRCRAASIPVGATTPGLVFALVAVTGAPVKNAHQTVATVQRGMEFEVKYPAGGRIRVTADQFATVPFVQLGTLRFKPGFGDAFRSRAGESSRLCFPYQKSGELKMIGIADHGTRVQAIFFGIPDGVRVFVANSTPRLPFIGFRAEIVESSSTLLPGSAVEIGHIETRELEITNGRPTQAVWEIRDIGALPVDGGSLDFAVYASANSDADKMFPITGPITVSGSFAPIVACTPFGPHFSLPLPSFIDIGWGDNQLLSS